MNIAEFINPDNRKQVEKLSDNDYLELHAQTIMCRSTADRIWRVLEENRALKFSQGILRGEDS